MGVEVVGRDTTSPPPKSGELPTTVSVLSSRQFLSRGNVLIKLVFQKGGSGSHVVTSSPARVPAGFLVHWIQLPTCIRNKRKHKKNECNHQSAKTGKAATLYLFVLQKHNLLEQKPGSYQALLAWEYYSGCLTSAGACPGFGSNSSVSILCMRKSGWTYRLWGNGEEK